MICCLTTTDVNVTQEYQAKSASQVSIYPNIMAVAVSFRFTS